MKYLPKDINWVKLTTKLMFLSSVAVLCITAYFVYKIDVLTNWHLELPPAPIHAGDSITVKSVYTKTRDVQGDAKRYIECWTEQDALITYPINERLADRPAGSGGTGLVLPIPTFIPDLPTECRIRVRVAYQVLPFRTVNETVISTTFELLPPRQTAKESSGNAQQSPAQSTSSQAQASSQFSSSSNSTASPQSPQRDSSQETGSTQATEDTGLINSLLKVIRGTL